MKKLLISLSFLALLQLQAADVVFNTGTATSYNEFSTGIKLTSIEVINGSTNNGTVKLYDSPTSGILWTNVAYTTTSTYVTNLVTTVTNFNGIVQNSTNTVTITAPLVVGATERTRSLIKTFIVPAGESSVWTPVGGVFTSFGLTSVGSANVTNVTLNITYSTLQ